MGHTASHGSGMPLIGSIIDATLCIRGSKEKKTYVDSNIPVVTI